jgi:hypothetical protein
VNDPTTAVQTLDEIDCLLRILVRRDLAVQQIDGSDGTARLILKLPTWEDYVSVGLDEIISMGNGSRLVETASVVYCSSCSRSRRGSAARRLRSDSSRSAPVGDSSILAGRSALVHGRKHQNPNYTTTIERSGTCAAGSHTPARRSF